MHNEAYSPQAFIHITKLSMLFYVCTTVIELDLSIIILPLRIVSSLGYFNLNLAEWCILIAPTEELRFLCTHLKSHFNTCLCWPCHITPSLVKAHRVQFGIYRYVMWRHKTCSSFTLRRSEEDSFQWRRGSFDKAIQLFVEQIYPTTSEKNLNKKKRKVR